MQSHDRKTFTKRIDSATSDRNGMEDEAVSRQAGHFRAGRCRHMHLETDVASGSRKGQPMPQERSEIVVDKQKQAARAYKVPRRAWLGSPSIYNRAGSQGSKWGGLNHRFVVPSAPAARTLPCWPRLRVIRIDE